MFGSSSSSSSSSQSESSLSSYIFQEESACAKICPNLTYTQRYANIVLLYILLIIIDCLKNNRICRLWSWRICFSICWNINIIWWY